MPQTNADRLLNRISALHKSLQLDEGGHISKMERDLMLNYLREFYEIYTSGTVAPPAPKVSAATIKETPKLEERPRPTPSPAPSPIAASPPASVMAPPSVSVPPTPPPPAPDSMVPQPEAPAYAGYAAPAPAPPSPPRRQTATPPVYAAPSPPPPRRAPEPVEAPTPPPAPSYSSRPATEQPDFAPAAAPEPTSSRQANPEIDALFEDASTKSRFGRQPISDLNRCLSINNRILFTRDLFGGDNDLLNTTLKQLNTSSTLEEARPLVNSLARRFTWAEESTQESAREFIELIRRRYV